MPDESIIVACCEAMARQMGQARLRVRSRRWLLCHARRIGLARRLGWPTLPLRATRHEVSLAKRLERILNEESS